MCGRYELHSHPATIALAFGLAQPPDVHPRYNIAPMTDVGIVRVNNEGEREFTRVRWGLVPRWSKDPSMGGRCQFSSTKARIELWSVSVWSTTLCFAIGEMTSSGRRGP